MSGSPSGTKIEIFRRYFPIRRDCCSAADFERTPADGSGRIFQYAAAAKKVAQDKDKTQAAIAARRAAKEYGLKYCRRVFSRRRTTVRDLLSIGKEPIYLPESHKTHFVLRCRMNGCPLSNLVTFFI